jgi:hypothetical protein
MQGAHGVGLGSREGFGFEGLGFRGLVGFLSCCRLLWLFLCIFPVYLGAPYTFLVKSILLIKNELKRQHYFQVPSYALETQAAQQTLLL